MALLIPVSSSTITIDGGGAAFMPDDPLLFAHPCSDTRQDTNKVEKGPLLYFGAMEDRGTSVGWRGTRRDSTLCKRASVQENGKDKNPFHG
jgi:hypothetical protein